jgi:cysteinyl-tRNA synthetase
VAGAILSQRHTSDRETTIAMKLYNAYGQRVETFAPNDGQPVSVYVCGITPYDTTHLGHAFTYTTFDILIRYLEWTGYRVRYEQNVTDIDDDILRKARETGEDWRALGNRWTRHFIDDMETLNVRPPDYYVRATDFIPGIVDTVARLVEVGVAYPSAGSVYYHVDNWPTYGELSRLPRETMLDVANERGNYPDDPRKRDPLDFVLWQAQAPGEPAWQSPWGAGRPGWHIECSTMSTALLGDTIDIHGGGADLIFPHHESEIAQAEAATGVEPFVRFWMHTAMVRHDGEKMSKSLGNLVMVNDLLRTCSPDALRLYLAQHHYREAWSFDQGELEKAAALADMLTAATTATANDTDQSAPSSGATDGQAAREQFKAAMDDDLGTPAALTALIRLGQETLAAARAGQDVRAAQATLRGLGSIFGLRLGAEHPEKRVIDGWQQHLARFLGD